LKTFMMMTKEGKVEKLVVAEFEAHGEVWVVHDKLGEFVVSHAGTGWGLNGCGAFDVETSKKLALDKLALIDHDKIKAGLETARNYGKEKE